MALRWFNPYFFIIQVVMSQIYLPCDIIPVPGCSCHDPERPIVTCQKMGLSTVPDFSGAHTLDLSYNNFTSISAGSFKNLHNLRRLYLNQNQIEFIDNTHAFQTIAPSIEHIDLSENKLQYIPAVFGSDAVVRLRYLKVLNLAGNDIRYLLNGDFEGVHQLQKLYLDGNSIEVIQKSAFRRISKLRTLTLGLMHDKLFPTNITTKFIRRVNALKVTGAKSVSLPDLSEWLNRFKKIEHLELSDMNFQDYHFYTGDFSTMFKINLRSLSLRNNSLTAIPIQIARLTNLISLDLSNNRITDLRYYASDIIRSSLQEFNLANNSLVYIDPDILLNLEGSTIIDLHDNKLETIDWTVSEIYSTFTPRMILELSGNPWRCSCRNEWLKTLVHRQLVWSNGHLRLAEIYDTLTCYSAVTSTQELVVNVPKEEFECSNYYP